MKTERANLALPVQIALAEMGAVIEEVLEEHGNQRFKELTLKQFCQLEKRNLYSTCGISFTYSGWIEELLKRYSLQFDMPVDILDMYELLYNAESEEETPPIKTEEDFFKAVQNLGLQEPRVEQTANKEHEEAATPSKSEPCVFDEDQFKEELKREIHRSPICRSRLTDIGWNMYNTAKEAYLNQPWYIKLFLSPS